MDSRRQLRILARVCTSTPKVPKPPPPTPAAETIDPAVLSAGQRERRRARTRYGLQSTILTSGAATPVTSQSKTLLGA